jgi:catechol 2,3-dioxygenase-like lactoylglutathione lyase family enzyme
MFTGKSDIMLYVSDFEQSADFYTRVLAFGVEGFWSDEKHGYFGSYEEAAPCAYVKLTAGGAGVALHVADDVAGGGGVYHFGVEDVDAYRQGILDRGGAPGEAKDFPWGWRMFFVKDPDGHLLGFYTTRAE